MEGQGRLGRHGKLQSPAKTGKIPLLLPPPHTCLARAPLSLTGPPELSSGKELLVHLEAGAGGGNVQEQKKRVCGVGRVLHSDCIYSFSVKVGKGVDKISFFPELQ